MARDQLVVGIDIGSSKIRTVVAALETERDSVPNIIGIGVSPSAGLRKGAIVDVNEAIGSITASLEEAERMCGEPIHHAVVSVGGAHIQSQPSHGVVTVGGGGRHEITESDTERALEAAQAVNIPANRQILRTIPQNYAVDGQYDLKNAIGMTGVRLEVIAHLVTGLTPALKNLEHAVHQSGVDVDDVVPTPLAAAEAVLDKRQKELGVVVIDIGAGSTSVAVFEEGVILHSAVLPVGGESVSNDIAIGLRTGIDTAEKMKIEYGTVQPREISDRETVDLSAISRSESQVVSKRQLAEIIQARYLEILEMAREELKRIERDGALPAGAILTGGGSKVPGLIELARETLSLPVTIGFPAGIDGMLDRVDDPSFCTAVGLIKFRQRNGRSGSMSLGAIQFGSAAEGLKNFFKKLLP